MITLHTVALIYRTEGLRQAARSLARYLTPFRIRRRCYLLTRRPKGQ